jgi:hypothetical protein
MKENRNEIELQATPKQVWQVLTDLDKYSEWNPLLYLGTGNIELGETVEVSAKTATKNMKFTCKVTEVEPYSKFAWSFHVIHPLIFRGKHIFQIDSIGEHKVKFIDREQFWGLLLPMQARDLQTNGLSAMIDMGEALKKKLERGK